MRRTKTLSHLHSQKDITPGWKTNNYSLWRPKAKGSMTTKKKKEISTPEAVMYVWRSMGTTEKIAFMTESWLHRYKGFE